MDVHLVIVDFSMHQKGFSVQRCDTAVRESLTREFGNSLPFVFYAPNWVAQYLAPSPEINVAAGGYEVARLVAERIKRLRAERLTGEVRVLVASYNHHVRTAAIDAGKANGVVVGSIRLADYANSRFTASNARVEWCDGHNLSQPTVGPESPNVSRSTEVAALQPIEVKATTPSNDNFGSDVALVDPYNRSRAMRAPLLAAKIFNEKPTRDLLFKTVKPIIDREPLQLSKLRRVLSEESFAASGITERGKWDTQVYFFVRLLLFSGTLWGSNGPITHGAGSDGKEVVKLSPALEDDAEAYLVEYVLRELGNVTEFEHCPLAHAILRCFDGNVDIFDLKDRVTFLISRFADRLSLSETGTYIHQTAVKQNTLRAVSRG